MFHAIHLYNLFVLLSGALGHLVNITEHINSLISESQALKTSFLSIILGVIWTKNRPERLTCRSAAMYRHGVSLKVQPLLRISDGEKRLLNMNRKTEL